MEKQEYIIRLSLLQQQAKQIEEHMGAIDLQIGEMAGIAESVEEIADLNDKNVMLSQLGRGVYAKTRLLEKKLFVNAGSNVIVRKTPEEIASILKNQIAELQKARENLSADLKKIIEVMQHFVKQA